MYRYRDLYVLDFSEVKLYSEIHDILKETFDFPEYYGYNWSAFRDCLVDMVGRPITVEIHGIGRLENLFEEATDKMIEIFKEVKHYDEDRYSNEINIAIVIGDHRCWL